MSEGGSPRPVPSGAGAPAPRGGARRAEGVVRGTRSTTWSHALENVLSSAIWTGIVLILLTPFVVSTQTLFPFVVGKALYSRSLIEIVFACWVLLALFRPSYRPPRSRILLLLAAALGVAVLAACLGVSVQRSFWSTYERMQGVVDQAHWFVLAVVLASVVRSPRDWRTLLNLALVTGAALALIAITQYVAQPDVRVDATLGNAIFLGAHLMVSVVIALGFLGRSFVSAAGPPSGEKRKAQRRPARRAQAGARQSTPPRTWRSPPALLFLWTGRCFWGAVTLLGGWALSLTASRGPFLGLLAGLAFAAVSHLFLVRTRKARRVVSGLAILVVATGGVVLLLLLLLFATPDSLPRLQVENPLAKRLIRLDEPRDSIETRLSAWRAATRGFFDRPVLGWGPGNYTVLFGRHVSGPVSGIAVHDHAHSELIEELVTKGSLGLLVYLALWALVFHVVVRAAKGTDPGERVLFVFVGAALMALLVQRATAPDTSVASLYTTLLFAFAVSLERGGGDPAPAAGRGTRLRAPIAAAAGMLGRLAGRTGVRVLLAAGASVLAGAGLFANQAAWSAASAGSRALASAADRAAPPGRTRVWFEQAIAGFKPLADYPRLHLFHYVIEHFEVLRSHDPAEAERLLALVDAEAEAAVESEPENWRIRVVLAWLYRELGISHPEYLDAARRHFDAARRLAPNRREVLSLTGSGG